MRSLDESYMGTNSFGAADAMMGPASYTVQGRNPGYSYNILPLSTNLQQVANDPDNSFYIYPGCTVRGVGINNKDKHYTGQVYRICKNSNGEIQFIYIRTFKTNKFVTIAADDNLELITRTEPTKDEEKTKFIMTPSYNVARL